MHHLADDHHEIDHLTSALYNCISFVEGGAPRLERIRDLLHPRALLINNSGPDPHVMGIEDFIDHYTDRLGPDGILSLNEMELGHRTEVFGDVAHRLSAYEISVSGAARTVTSRGVNSIQFVRAGGRWRVTTIAWAEETEDRLIPSDLAPRETESAFLEW